MAKPLVELFKEEIYELLGYLISKSLVDSQSMPARRDRGNNVVLLQSDYWDNAPRMQRKISYSDLYEELVEAGAYDMRFLDGALVQLQYEFAADSGLLRRSRAAFLPSPNLIPYQEQNDLYLTDEIYGDVVDERVVTVPLRFDFDSRDGVVKDLHHPASHLTIGQYPFCRLATTSPITPYHFLELILRAFYRTKDYLDSPDLPKPRAVMPKTITLLEEGLAHIRVPHVE